MSEGSLPRPAGVPLSSDPWWVEGVPRGHWYAKTKDRLLTHGDDLEKVVEEAKAMVAPHELIIGRTNRSPR